MHSDDETPTNNDTPPEQRGLVSLRREVPFSDRHRSAVLAGVLSLAGVALGFGLGQVSTANSNCATSHHTVVHRQPILGAAMSIPVPQPQLTWLGVHVEGHENETRGALITRVVPGSPAAQAGLEKGQRIIQLGESPVFGPGGLVQEVQRRRIGQSVRVQTLDPTGAVSTRPVTLDTISPRAIRLLQDPRGR